MKRVKTTHQLICGSFLTLLAFIFFCFPQNQKQEAQAYFGGASCYCVQKHPIQIKDESKVALLDWEDFDPKDPRVLTPKSKR